MFRSLKWLKNTHSLVEEYTACKRHGETSSWWPLIKMMMMILMMMAMVMILMTIMVLITMMTHDNSHNNDDNGERVNLWRNEIGRPNHPTAWKLEVSKLKQILWVKHTKLLWSTTSDLLQKVWMCMFILVLNIQNHLCLHKQRSGTFCCT